MTRLFYKIAHYCEKTYGVQYDRDEKFFCCPECGEPLYKADWDDDEFIDDIHINCPVCEGFLMYMEDDCDD